MWLGGGDWPGYYVNGPNGDRSFKNLHCCTTCTQIRGDSPYEREEYKAH